tara:strand:+ start:3046 stop:3819 length:774 start_codon:yes stop_codon:yes gene_type:complete
MKKISNILRELKKLGVTGVKQSTEDEGSSFKDIILMRKITQKIGINLNIKIGGCEAKNDIFFCKRAKVDGIVAPMIESEYALKKFIQCASISKKNLLFMNFETILAVKNLKKIISSKSFKYIDGIIVGRSDLAGSMQKEKNFVNSKKIFKIAENCYKQISKNVKRKLIFKMGGSITPLSKSFIANLFRKKFLNYIETRNIEIKLSKKSIKNLDNIISKAFEFEVEWLKIRMRSIKKIDPILAKEYQKRILEINKRNN